MSKRFMKSTSVRWSKAALWFGLTVVLCAGAGPSVLGQIAARPDRGTRAAGSYSVSDIENINMTNGNVGLSIPLASLPPIAGGKLSWTIAANYNSKNWDMIHDEKIDLAQEPDIPPTRWMTSHMTPNPAGPWSIGGLYSIEVSESRDDVDWELPHQELHEWIEEDYELLVNQHSLWYKVVLTTPDGATHELRPVDESGLFNGNGTIRPFLLRYSWKTPKSINSAMNYYSYDGSYIWARIQPFTGSFPLDWDLYINDGTHIKNASGTGSNSGQFTFDTNGNSIRAYSSFDGGSQVTTHYVDQQTQREIRCVFDSATNRGKVQYQAVGAVSWNPSDIHTIDINFRTTSVSGWSYFTGDQPCGSSAELINWNQSNDLTVVDSIVLPQTETGITRQFSFEYNSDTLFQTDYEYMDQACNSLQVNNVSHGLGSLSKMTMPSGAQVSYSYSLDIPQPAPGQNALAEVLDAIEFPGEKVSNKEVAQDGVTDRWDFGIGTGVFSQSRIDSLSDGSFTVEKHFPHDPALSFNHGSDGYGGLAYSTNQSDRVLVERKWKFNTENGQPAAATGSGQLIPSNPVVDMEFTTLMDPPGTPVKMSAKKFGYDLNGNVLSETDYDWFSPTDSGLMRDSTYGFPTQIPTGAQKLRILTNSYHNPTTSSQNIYYNRVNGNPPTPLILNAVKETTQQDASEVALAKTRFQYDGNNLDSQFDTVPTVGNVTKIRQDKDGTWINTFHTYDSYGNVLTTTDPRGKIATIAYDTATHAQPISVTVEPNAGNDLTTTTEYDFATGAVKKVTDPNQNESTTSYDNQNLGSPNKDPFARPGLVTDQLGHKTKTFYHDNSLQVETRSDLKTTGDQLLNSRTTHDKLGRVVKSESSEDTSAYTLITDVVYEQGGKFVFTSNPHRSASASTDGWTRTKRDELGRVIEVATFDGATKPLSSSTSWNGRVQTSYSQTSFMASEVTVTDQAGKVRRSLTDGLGRLIRLDEPDSSGNPGTSSAPTQPTSYSYDALGNLKQVTQGSQQLQRLFTYDSLSRLKSAKNPEQVNISGQMVATTYEYDDASNLLSKTGPNAGTSVSFTYDGLNRVLTKTLTKPGASTVWDYTYDTATVSNAKGRLVSVVLHNSTDGYYYDGYDKLGRATSSHQITTADSQARSYPMIYEYDVSGNMKRQVYPSSKAFVYEYDNAGRMSGVKKEGANYYAGAAPTDTTNRIQYTAHGAMGAMKLGNGKWERTLFNGRLQPTEIDLGATNGASDLLKLEYGYGATTNNGNVLTQRLTAPKTAGGSLVLDQNYIYDSLNRITIAEELIGSTSQWNQTYDIDRWGNRAVNSASSYIPSPGLTPQSLTAFDTATNRIKPAVMTGTGYDTAGNLTSQPNPGVGADSMEYDAENHQTSYTKTGVGGGTTNYSYDGDGRRVKKVVGSVTTIFVYNVAGQLIAEYTSDPAPPPQGGGGTSYLTSDHLGSTRVVTRADGSVKERYDYLPFGEQIDSNHGSRSLVTGYVGSDGTRQKFTQKERDIESGLDYFGQRYYSSAQGRFTSTDSYDPALSRQVAANRDEAEEEFRKYLMQSQHWNRYPYVINNPLRYLDPNGEQELEAITRAVAKVAGALAKYRGIVGRGVTQAAVQTALELAFGPALDFKPGNLRYPHEIDFAKTVMYMEGKSFMGFGGPTEPGIDGLLYDPGFTLSLNLNPQAVSLTETGGTVGTILNRATLHETSASDAGYKKVDLYINATNKDVDVARMVDFAKGGKQNLLEITKRGVIKSITIVLKDGVVRIQDGKVYGGIAQ